ncbi:MAG: hypothetical protein JHC61_05330 [Burkholderiaceae bacterium]|nr:hypothetical protein [Burkholderiaceae bacterium]
MDDVTHFLRGEGLQPAAQRFLGSDFLLGYRIATEHFVLIYRQEGERLLLCDFAAATADGQAVIALRTLVRRIASAVPAVRYVDAMILTAPHDAALNRARERLADLMLAEGAQPIVLQDEQWLRYRCH